MLDQFYAENRDYYELERLGLGPTMAKWPKEPLEERLERCSRLMEWQEEKHSEMKIKEVAYKQQIAGSIEKLERLMSSRIIIAREWRRFRNFVLDQLVQGHEADVLIRKSRRYQDASPGLLHKRRNKEKLGARRYKDGEVASTSQPWPAFASSSAGAVNRTAREGDWEDAEPVDAAVRIRDSARGWALKGDRGPATRSRSTSKASKIRNEDEQRRSEHHQEPRGRKMERAGAMAWWEDFARSDRNEIAPSSAPRSASPIMSQAEIARSDESPERTIGVQYVEGGEAYPLLHGSMGEIKAYLQVIIKTSTHPDNHPLDIEANPLRMDRSAQWVVDQRRNVRAARLRKRSARYRRWLRGEDPSDGVVSGLANAAGPSYWWRGDPEANIVFCLGFCCCSNDAEVFTAATNSRTRR